ncbi:MAG TPA: glycosyltransferase family 1 protein, partial [Dysgonomonas sp.]|nr:glycosyltransferase family 1 protein [Dysgonomonas sp.]
YLITENVVMPGYLDDEALIERYRNALFFIYPSLYEGFGIPPLEAMSYGCPVINSDIPALRETSGDGALYTDPYDIEDMTAKMNLLLQDDDLRKSFQTKGYEQVKKYSWEKSARKVLDLANRYM